MNESRLGSDHSPIALHLKSESKFHRRIFRFEEKWLEFSACRDVIQEAWNANSNGSVQDRLSLCQKFLQLWAKRTVGNSKLIIHDLLNQLQHIQSCNSSSFPYEEEQRISKEITDQWNLEEKFWH